MEKDVVLQVGSTLGATLLFVIALILLTHFGGGKFMVILAVIGFIVMESAVGYFIADRTSP